MATKEDPQSASVEKKEEEEGGESGSEEGSSGSEEGTADNGSADAGSTKGLITPDDAVSKRTIWLRRGIIAFVVIFVIVAIALAVTLSQSSADEAIKVDNGPVRYDCHPDQGLTDAQMKDNCASRGCEWESGAAANTPKCWYPDDYKNYVVQTVSYFSESHIAINLNKTERSSGFPEDIQNVAIDVQGIDENVIRIKVYDHGAQRWEVPLPILNLKPSSHHSSTDKKPLPKYNISADWNELKITRAKTGQVIFQTQLSKLIFANQFIQLTTNVSSDSLYGLGERLAPHQKSLAGLKPNDRQVFTFMNHDGVENSKSSYSSHPFYLMYETEDKDEAHGVLLLNSNPMDVTFTQTPALTYRTIGGVLDFLIFMGPTAVGVLRQKANVIGKAPMPPYWSLGFHLSKWGYKNASQVYQAFENNTQKGVPIDVQWTDIDYMDNFEIFTYDKVNFGQLPELTKYFHKINRRFVPIIDPSIGYNSSLNHTTEAYQDGLKKDVFIKDDKGHLLVTAVWNPLSVIPDFTHPNAGAWWTQWLQKLYTSIPFDGLWIDMNEPATTAFYGSVNGCTNGSLDRPQYNPIHPQVLEHGTICMSARQNLSRHYNLHNMFSLFQGKLTYDALLKIRGQKRPFILSRDTSTGQGSYTSHWLGDVTSSWEHMRSSIPSILDFNLFGIPLVGSDICGFNGNTTDELCTRWTSLGSFYTFSRNHNSNNNLNQDPASMGQNVLAAATKSLNTRYTLLPYLYTLFWHNTLSGDPVLRSLKMNFPRDPNTNSNDRQFMWGDGLLVNPVLEAGFTSLDAYFPAGIWYDYHTGHVLSKGHARNITLQIPLTDINIALRGGIVFPTIPSENQTTADHKQLPFTILATLDERQSARGDLYWDDGEALNAATDEAAHSHIKFLVVKSRLVSTPQGTGSPPLNVSQVKVWGVAEEVKRVVLIDGESRTVLTHSYVSGRLTADLPPGTDLLKKFAVQWT